MRDPIYSDSQDAEKMSLGMSFVMPHASCFAIRKASTHFDHMSPVTRQCIFPSEGVNSMNYIIMCSECLSGGGWAIIASTLQTSGLKEMQLKHVSQFFFLTTGVKPLINQFSCMACHIPPFDTQSHPCGDLAKRGVLYQGCGTLSFGPVQVAVEQWLVASAKCDNCFFGWIVKRLSVSERRSGRGVMDVSVFVI